MRLELNIPDELDEDLKAKVIAVVERLEIEPSFAEGIDLEDLPFAVTPELLEELDEAARQLDRGETHTMEEVREHFRQKSTDFFTPEIIADLNHAVEEADRGE